ncbi:MAG TPA: nucleotidyltransferase family protein [Chloroflexota bacterium]|nr:nucleotidyltransferase family protein [Chloroflexota bacterium]
MRPSGSLETHRESLRALVARHQVENPRVFGSALRRTDTEDSDLDLLVDPTPWTTLMDLAALQLEAEALLGVRVDVLTPNFLSPAFRDRVLAEAAAV